MGVDPCGGAQCECGNRMSKATQKRRKGNLGHVKFVCVDCQNKELWHRDAKVKVVRTERK